MDQEVEVKIPAKAGISLQISDFPTCIPRQVSSNEYTIDGKKRQSGS